MAAPMGCIGLDFGTTHIKAGLFDQAGKRIRLEKVPTPQTRDDYGTVYDAAQIAETVTRLLQALAETGVPIRLISVTGMAEAGVMVERSTGRCLCPLLPWFDPRTQALAGAVSREEAHRRFFQTGLRNSFKYGIYKYRWALAHTRAAPEQTLWLSAVDYLVYLLTGQAVTDPTYAARTYAYNLDTGDFDWEYLSPLGLGRDNFPRVVPSGSRVGLCRLPGLTGAAVHIAAHDHVSAAYAISLAAEGWICDSCGTAETYIGTFPARPLTEADWCTGCIYGPYPGNRRFWMANISSSGLAVEWFRQQVQLTRLDYDKVNAILAAPGGPTGIFFLPALTGMGTPCFRQELRAAFLGLAQHHTGEDMLRAVVEGLGYQARMILEPMEVPGVVSVGGAAQSPGWMQRKADILGCPVQTLEEGECTVLGAIALALCAESQEEARRFCGGMQPGPQYLCRPQAHSAYTGLYRNYQTWFRLLTEPEKEEQL